MMPNSSPIPAVSAGKAESKTTPPAITTKAAKASDGLGTTIADILNTDYRGMSLYSVAMVLLVVAILWTGVKTAQQVQNYHQLYGQMTKLKKQFRQLQIERQRMLIEQQTFSGTPQVTNRAVAELNMYYPNLSDRMIIHANNVVTSTNSPTNVTNSSANPVFITPTPASASATLPIDPSTQH